MTQAISMEDFLGKGGKLTVESPKSMSFEEFSGGGPVTIDKPLQKVKPPVPTTMEKIGNTAKAVGKSIIGSELRFGQSIGDALYAGTAQQGIADRSKQRQDMLDKAIKIRAERKAAGLDISHTDQIIRDILNTKQENLGDIVPSANKTAAQIAGEGLGVATDIATFGSYGKAAQGAVTGILSKAAPNVIGTAPKALSFTQGFAQGFKSAAPTGAIFGAAKGGTNAMQDNKSAGDTAVSTVVGGVTGGLAAGLIGGTIQGVSGAIRGRQLRKEELAKIMEDPNSSISQKLMNRNPDVPLSDVLKNDPQIQKATQNGIGDTEALITKMSSKSDKAKMNQMLDIARVGQNNPVATARPTDIVGETFVTKAKQAQTLLKKATDGLDEAATVLKGKPSDFTPVLDDLKTTLDNAGVTIKGGKLDFIGSDFEGITSAEKALQKTYDRATAIGNDSMLAHRFKSWVYNTVSYDKAGEGVSGYASKIIKDTARGVDTILDTNFPTYNNANVLFKDTIGVLDDISQFVGKDVLKTDLGNVKAGMVLRRLLSNAPSRADLLQLLGNMDDLLAKNGFKSTDSIVNQVVFTDVLENIFGNKAPNSLQGQIQKGIVGGAEQLASKGTFGSVKDLLVKGVSKLNEKDISTVVDALRGLLK